MPSHREYWERNIEGFAGFYDSGSEEQLGGPAVFRMLYRRMVMPVEKIYMRKRYNIVRQFISDYVKPGMTVADVGCGTGIFSILMAEQGAKVFAMDFAEAALALTRRNIPPDLASSIETGRLDISRTSIPRVDCAIAIGLLPYVEDSQVFLSNCIANCDIGMFNYLDRENIVNRTRMLFRSLDPRHYYYHRTSVIEAQLDDSKHEVISRMPLATGHVVISRRRQEMGAGR